jgi:hypothetical protein
MKRRSDGFFDQTGSTISDVRAPLFAMLVAFLAMSSACLVSAPPDKPQNVVDRRQERVSKMGFG